MTILPHPINAEWHTNCFLTIGRPGSTRPSVATVWR